MATYVQLKILSVDPSHHCFYSPQLNLLCNMAVLLSELILIWRLIFPL